MDDVITFKFKPHKCINAVYQGIRYRQRIIDAINNNQFPMIKEHLYNAYLTELDRQFPIKKNLQKRVLAADYFFENFTGIAIVYK
ncbi:MAG: hypothetical protein ACTSW4_04705 [Candidatus Ranarchaeia archaeon]